MQYFSATLLLLLAPAVVKGTTQYFCGGGTSADPSIKCAKGQYVFCCDAPGNEILTPTRREGFPTSRSCGTTGLSCTVLNSRKNELTGFAACVSTCINSVVLLTYSTGESATRASRPLCQDYTNILPYNAMT
ncbi:hypothetical protein M3J09_001927 [Ascochyta lentis]